MLLVNKNKIQHFPQNIDCLEVWIFQGYLPVCTILFGRFQRRWTVISDDAIFRLIWIYPEVGISSTMANFYIYAQGGGHGDL